MSFRTTEITAITRGNGDTEECSIVIRKDTTENKLQENIPSVAGGRVRGYCLGKESILPVKLISIASQWRDGQDLASMEMRGSPAMVTYIHLKVIVTHFQGEGLTQAGEQQDI